MDTAIIFYNVSHNNLAAKIPDGTKIKVEDLIAINLQSNTLPEEVRLMMLSLKTDCLDPLGIDRSSRWENLMSVIIFCLSGQLPLRQEVLRGRQIMMALPRHLKTPIYAEKIAFSLLPYILIGFKTHIEDHFQADSNTIADAITFIDCLYNTSNPIARSFLCAHRGKSKNEKHILSESVQLKKALVALNVTKGILANNPGAETSSMYWHQQGPTEWACLNMFPEMFLRYLTSGEISYMLTLLDRHFKELGELLAIRDPNCIKAELIGQDLVTLDVLSFVSKRYGHSWRSTDFSKAEIKKDILIDIALEIALPDVVRLMPFYSSSHSSKKYIDEKSSYIANNVKSSLDSNPVHTNLIKHVIERFFENQLMHPTAKALYESAFYYIWGKRSAVNKNEIAIGIDRDHNNFQYTAWKQGYIEEMEGDISSIPLLYARRTNEDAPGSALKDYCIRQFWR